MSGVLGRVFGRLWLRRSLRFRITTVGTAVTLVVFLTLAVVTSRLIGPLLVTAADAQLRPILAEALADVRSGAPVDAGPVGMEARVLDTAGTPVDGDDPPPLSPGELRVLKAGEPVLRLSEDPPRRWVGTVATAPGGEQRLVVVGTILTGYWAAQHRAFNWLVVAALIGSAAGGIATWLGVRSSLRPVERMRAAAAGLPAGRRLPLPGAHDELRSLAAALNGLLARRDEASARLRRFTGDAAHELRSPVASIRVQAEVAVANPDPELSQEVLADVVVESERLSLLVDGLLALARSDAGEWPAALPVDVVAAARSAIDRLPDDAPVVGTHLAPGACWVEAAPAEVDLVLDNLLRNAARHARARITVTVLSRANTVWLVVDDDGHGIAPEHRERVFDRFYRVQDDRSRDSGGAGLGLALVAEVVRRRGGTVKVTESPEGGARFQVRWRALT
ncbi:sensor histidine kinase [Actinophytocola algeriensis]|uniref:histidine kinase n=1 Tax=Actinophytocola algeriensis TaxID=1768010 RepID=A0A7W7QE68_9PSEU|nr:HAMP domain-containing sensor histidine kinase [Actinophytocola algeriensis]MBB4911947.1 signal transduction histidine kinase [Actinophytocola algeriensis]MBE1477561.1 signal transduction histidine kinase [Actinophytocola algeriensis]